MTKSVELLSLVEDIETGIVKNLMRRIRPHVEQHADKYVIHQGSDASQEHVHVIVNPKRDKSIHHILKSVSAHVPVIGARQMGPKTAVMDLHQSVPHRTLRVRFEQKNDKDYEEHLDGNKTKFDFMDDNTKDMLKKQDKKKKDKPTPYEEVVKRYRHRNVLW